MTVYIPDHTVQIDDFKCIAMDVRFENPYRKRLYEDIQLEDSYPKKFRAGWELRKIQFTAEISGNYLSTQDILKTIIDKVVKFTSIYAGSFSAIVEYSIVFEDGSPNETMVEFRIEEVTNDILG